MIYGSYDVTKPEETSAENNCESSPRSKRCVRFKGCIAVAIFIASMIVVFGCMYGIDRPGTTTPTRNGNVTETGEKCKNSSSFNNISSPQVTTQDYIDHEVSVSSLKQQSSTEDTIKNPIADPNDDLIHKNITWISESVIGNNQPKMNRTTNPDLEARNSTEQRKLNDNFLESRILDEPTERTASVEYTGSSLTSTDSSSAPFPPREHHYETHNIKTQRNSSQNFEESDESVESDREHHYETHNLEPQLNSSQNFEESDESVESEEDLEQLNPKLTDVSAEGPRNPESSHATIEAYQQSHSSALNPLVNIDSSIQQSIGSYSDKSQTESVAPSLTHSLTSDSTANEALDLLTQPLNYSLQHETEKKNTNLNSEQNLEPGNTAPTDELSMQLENPKLDNLAIENQWPQNSFAHNLFKIEGNPLNVGLTTNSTEDQSKMI
ncbi:uncharacterized protein LOC125177976 [Hyalella azteca]|uniref:Uncharacterized protein LOC125177976 n=1 Tax=Hyalella azteca TaxID=294128 RepID=A0A979FJ39_HYAAZ|nr:uncharacterized protein LOC125177976 [Hyalella azteca]